MDKPNEFIDKAGYKTKLEYDLMCNVASVTDQNGNKIEYNYNKLHHLESTTDAEGHITRYEHDPNGNVTVVTSPNGARTEIKYDALNRVVEVMEPDLAVTKYEYDNAGNIVKVVDPMGNSTRQVFDSAGQLVETIDPLGNSTRLIYSPLGKVEMVTDAKGGVLRYEYNPGGRLKRVILPEGENESYEYDGNGNTIKVINGLGYETSLIYDSLDRLTEIKNPLGHSKRFTYDAVGNILEVIDESGNLTQYRYSLLGDIIEVIDALGHSTKYEYDKTRRLNRVEQYRLIGDTLADIKKVEAQITNYERNKKGEVTAIKSPLDKVVRFKCDGMGNVVSKLDEDGLETLYEYNLVNKLSKISYADGKTVALSYNPLKQLTEMKDWLGITTIETDVIGRTEKVTDFEGKTIQYGWDELNRKEKIVYPDSSEVKYTYNCSSNLSSVISSTGKTLYQYDAMGQIRERILPNELTTRYEFDKLGRIVSLAHSNGDDILDQFNYDYDPTGNITRIDKYRDGLEADNGIFDYSYDSMGRLVKASNGDRTKKYIYDSLGNRLGSVENSHTVRHQYNALNQLIRTNDGECVEEYRYDKRGNLTAILINNTIMASYVFDATNMMTEAISTEKAKAKYTYDGFRNRVKRLEQFESLGSLMKSELQNTIPTSEVRYIHDMTRPYNNLLMTEGGQTQRYIWGNEILEAEGANPFYFLQDHLGSPIRLMGGAQNTPLAYDEFGVLLVEVGNIDNPFGFTGYQMDSISGLYYAQARYYNPLISRMLSPDPVKGNVVNPQSINAYIYVLDNPLKYTDPLGLRGETVISGDASYGKYKIGTPVEPDFSFWCAEDYIYDPKAVATAEDKKSWNAYGSLLLKAQIYNSQPKFARQAMTWVVGLFNQEDAEMAKKRVDSDLSEALELYAHYRSAEGTTKYINLEKAYGEDQSIKMFIDGEIANLKKAAENIYFQKMDCTQQDKVKFQVTGSLVGMTENGFYPELENWQKALGDFLLWLSADITYDPKTQKATASITIHSLDMYNFNKGAKDVFTGLPDNANGRFVELGWAKSFLTKGSFTMEAGWNF